MLDNLTQDHTGIKETAAMRFYTRLGAARPLQRQDGIRPPPGLDGALVLPGFEDPLDPAADLGIWAPGEGFAERRDMDRRLLERLLRRLALFDGFVGESGPEGLEPRLVRRRPEQPCP